MDSVPPYVFGVGFVALLVVAFIVISRAGERMQAELARRIAEAQPAEAELLEVRTAPMQQSNRARMSVIAILRVYPPGAAAHDGVGTWEIETVRLAELQVGRRLPVKVARDDPQTIFPAVPGFTHDLGNHQLWLNERKRQAGT